MKDSSVCHGHRFASAAGLPYDDLAVDHTLPPLGMQASNLCHHLSSEATELTHSSGLKNKLDHTMLPATADNTELDTIFAGKANVPFTTVLNEDCGGPASTANYESAMPSEPAWLAHREPATSLLDGASPHTNAVDRLFEGCARARQDLQDNWANCRDFASSDVPDLHELFGARGHQIASLQASVDADNQAAWDAEPNTEVNRSGSDLW